MPRDSGVLELWVSFASALDPELASWITTNGKFASSMVDRIVPAVTAADIAQAEELSGLVGWRLARTPTSEQADPGAVATEKFKQWVIEDNFVDGARPPWEQVGALLVKDVEPFENMKLRMLNGTHSTFAYCSGFLQ